MKTRSSLYKLLIYVFLFLKVIDVSAQSNNNLPNIVFILVDDMGWRDVGYKGNKYVETPNIDKLSTQGMVFNYAYSNAPNCAPTRAALISGKYGPRTRIYTVSNADRGESKNRKLIPVLNKTVLDASFYTLPEALKDRGYVTGMFGKWHLGDSVGTSPEGQGFDVNVAGGEAGAPKTYFSPYHLPHLTDGKPGEELTERLTSEAIKFVDQNKNKPFFLYLPFYAVHVPLSSTPELVAKYKAKSTTEERYDPIYAAIVETVDTQVGRLLAHLEEQGLTKNTIVVFTSDNGGYFPVTTLTPLRGSKGSLYEGGIRVPLIIKWPGKIKEGSVSNVPVMSMDYYPTFLAITGAKVPEHTILDGVNILPVLTQSGKLKERNLYWHFPAYLEPNKGMKQMWRQTPGSAIRKGDFKLIETFEDHKVELYNLKDDESEKNNIADKNPGKTKELLSDLQQWRKDLNAFVPSQPNPEYQPQNNQ